MFTRFIQHQKLSWLMLLTFPAYLSAQDQPYKDVSIASPTAASLGKYADIPVNYHTGLPQISIPMYTVKSGPLELPIGLSFHAGGLKVSEASSWVGAGWSLNAGGVITRSVMGQPDERGTNSGLVSTKGHFSDYGYNSYVEGGGQVQDWRGFADGRKDGEPDLFFFNFGGYTGKFYFRDDRTPVLVPQQDIKIIPYYPADDENYVVVGPGGGSIQGFTIVTPDGTKYYFGNTAGFADPVLPVEVTNPYSIGSGYSSASAISSWFLHKISTADDLFTINLKYAQENFGYFMISSTPIDSHAGGGFGPGVQEYNIIKNITRGVRLTDIIFPGGTVVFTPDDNSRTDLSDDHPEYEDHVNTSAKALKKITISNGLTFTKHFIFSYDYFEDNVSTLPTAITGVGFNLFTDKKRLKLLSIQEASDDGTIINPPYQFAYFSEFVPRRVSFAQDHWGFYNGTTGNTSLIPTFITNDGTSLTTVNGANRQSAWPAMRGGALKEIIYPTGGSSKFDFEPADQFTSSSTTLENVPIVIRMSVHLYGQNTEFNKTQSFTSNGNPITFSGTNTTLFFAPYIVRNSSNVQVASGNFTNGVTQSFTLNLPAGNYTVRIDVNTGTANSLGVVADMHQLGYVSHTSTTIIGGLRIQRLTHLESTSAVPIVTQYEYPNGGYLYSVPVYVQHIRNDLVQTLGYYRIGQGFVSDMVNINGCPSTNGFYLKSGGSIRPMASVQGNHIGYPFVKVRQIGNGYSEYHYRTSNSGYSPGTADLSTPIIDVSLSSACSSTVPNYPTAPLPFDYQKGELYYERHLGETTGLLKDIYYTSEYNLTPQESTPAFMITARSNGMLLGTYYTLSSPRKTKMITEETNYTPGAGSIKTTTTVFYESAFHNQVTRQLTVNSVGDNVETKFKYAADFRLSTCDNISDGSPELAAALNSCQITYNSAVANCNTNYSPPYANPGLCFADKYMVLQTCKSQARITYVTNRRDNFIKPGNLFQYNHDYARDNTADAELKPILALQDEYYNPIIETTSWKNNLLLGASFNKFGYVQSPVNKVYPQQTKAINLNSPSSSFTVSSTSANATITKDNRYTDEASYRYNQGNPADVTPRSGITTAYLWNYDKTLPVAKVDNAVQEDIAFSSFETADQGGWTINTGAVIPNQPGASGNAIFSGTLTKSLIHPGNYVVKVWVDGSAAVSVNGNAGTYLRSGLNGWKLYQWVLTNVNTITVQGTNMDDVSLYPKGAQMSTYTYTPLLGMVAGSNPNNVLTYYEYDKLGRLKWIKDGEGNIVKTIHYHFKDQPADQ